MRASVMIGVALMTFGVSCAVGWVIARCAARPLDQVIRWGSRLAARRRTVTALVGGLAALLAAMVCVMRPPLPRVADEFSYLLAADTFARGRLTNPPHPLWPFFETFHVIQQPTYASKYPPAQGMVLAFGKVLAGTPDVGLWISVGLAAASVCWMLQGWVPGRWALLGGLLVATHCGIQIEWTQTYWGGNVALIGGSLLLGAYARVRRRVRARDALVMGLGLAVLANSRPFEGLAISLPVAAAMALCLLGRRRPASAVLAARLLIPLGAALLAAGAWMAYYNQRVTGDPMKLPYMVHESTYGCAPALLWQAPPPIPEYRHVQMRRLHLWLRDTFHYQRVWRNWLAEKWTGVLNLWSFLLGFWLTIPLLTNGVCCRRSRFILPVAVLVSGLLAFGVETWSNPHYFAPAVPALWILVVQGIRRLSVSWWRRRPRRAVLIRVLMLAYFLGFGVAVRAYVGGQPSEFGRQRAELLGRLERSGDRHLVVVRYTGKHNIHEEWVQNGAEIDEETVVWARSMGADADQRLYSYFADRRIWLLMPDETPPRLVPYDAAGNGDSLAQSVVRN